MSEARLKQRITDYLKAQSPALWYAKIGAGMYQRPGLPDIIGCVRGRMFAIELKHGDNVLTALQEVELERLRAAGCAVCVAYDLDTVKRFIAAAS